MTLPPIVQGLPYMVWVILVTLAVGSFIFVALTRQLSDATRGYLGFSAFLAATLAGLALAVDGGLPPPGDLVIVAASPAIMAVRQVALAAFAVLSIAYLLALRVRLPSLPTAVATLAAGAVVLIAAAVGWAPTLTDAVPLLVQLAVLSVVTGGSLAAIVLGHWYLVTPRLSERPLVLQSRWLLAAIGLQVLLFVIWTTLGGGPGQAAFEALAGGTVLLVGLRLLVSLAFPLVLTYMAMRTAVTRSMESATGLLYINLAAVLAGTIGAAALYVSSGLLV
jgi:hypothetical protein